MACCEMHKQIEKNIDTHGEGKFATHLDKVKQKKSHSPYIWSVSLSRLYGFDTYLPT